MAGRRTNQALLILLGGSLLTGALAFGVGSGWAVWVAAAHGAVGLGILLLAPWKSVIVRRSLRRDRPGSGASLALALLVAVALATGVSHSTGLLRSVAGVTAIQIHVTAAVLSIPLAVWHVVARRVRWRRTDLSRRNLLRAGGLALGSAALFGAVAGAIRVTGLPGRRRRVTGSYEEGSFRPPEMPVTQWLNDSVPLIDGSAWTLGVLDRGTELFRLSLDEVDGMSVPIRALIDCTGGWFAIQDWEGARLDWLLFSTQPGESILVRSRTGYARRFPSRDATRLWVATRAGGEPLSAGHGFPARIVAPNRRGFWWVKWVDSIEVSDTPWWLQSPFPLT
jgi:Oxidoreductase molybdopterin binding domain